MKTKKAYAVIWKDNGHIAFESSHGGLAIFDRKWRAEEYREKIGGDGGVGSIGHEELKVKLIKIET